MTTGKVMNDHNRLVIFIAVASAHIIMILGFSLSMAVNNRGGMENSRTMELADFQYAGNPHGGSKKNVVPAQKAQPSPESVDPTKESISDQKTEKESAGDNSTDGGEGGYGDGDGSNLNYLPMQKISQMPIIAEKSIRTKLMYPEMARKAGIEGLVYLELFIDSIGKIRKISVLKENPAGYGFAAAAVNAFDGCTCVPAKANGETVSVRFRYPIRFSLN